MVNIQDRGYSVHVTLTAGLTGQAMTCTSDKLPSVSPSNYQVASPECFRLLSTQPERQRAAKDTKFTGFSLFGTKLQLGWEDTRRHAANKEQLSEVMRARAWLFIRRAAIKYLCEAFGTKVSR